MWLSSYPIPFLRTVTDAVVVTGKSHLGQSTTAKKKALQLGGDGDEDEDEDISGETYWEWFNRTRQI